MIEFSRCVQLMGRTEVRPLRTWRRDFSPADQGASFSFGRTRSKALITSCTARGVRLIFG